jgi:hypothetical protein
MADVKITALAVLTAADPINDAIPIVDVSDTTMAASGTTKRISVNNILSSSPTATGAFSVTGLVTAGSATITGDLTVDTSTLKVDSTNNRVGIVQATPLYPLHLVGEFGLEEASSGNGTKLRFIGDASKYNFRLGKQLTATNTFEITPSTAIGGTTFSNPVYTVTYDGTHTFLDGAGGTRMTLNSNGLGVGIVPGSGIAPVLLGVGVAKTAGTSAGYQIYQGSTEVVRLATDNTNIYIQGITNLPMRFYTNNVNTMTLDASGNLILLSSATPATLATNGQLTVNATSNTNLRFSYRGSDGTTRVANITLA